MPKQYTIDELKRIISPIAAQHGVNKISLFGSYAKDTAAENSDIDLLIEKGKLSSLFHLCGFRLAVEDALNCPVDLVTSDSSNKEFLRQIAKDALPLYRGS